LLRAHSAIWAGPIGVLPQHVGGDVDPLDAGLAVVGGDDGGTGWSVGRASVAEVLVEVVSVVVMSVMDPMCPRRGCRL
jgi:hypothetical protein